MLKHMFGTSEEEEWILIGEEIGETDCIEPETWRKNKIQSAKMRGGISWRWNIMSKNIKISWWEAFILFFIFLSSLCNVL